MNSLLRRLWALLLRLVRHFAHPDRGSERQLFGFGQFVLLICLTPFILSMTLFSLGEQESPPSQYSTNIERFIPLDYPTTIEVPGHSPGIVVIARRHRVFSGDRTGKADSDG